jgi:hypothetical protein
MFPGAIVQAETQEIERYLLETLGLTARLAAWESSGRLPLNLRDGFRYYWADLLSVPCLLMVDRAQEPAPPGDHPQEDGPGAAQVGRRADLRA